MCGGSEWGVVCVLLESCGIRSAVCMRTDNGERGESGEFGSFVSMRNVLIRGSVPLGGPGTERNGTEGERNGTERLSHSGSLTGTERNGTERERN